MRPKMATTKKLNDHYRIEKLIGKGSYAIVHIATHIKLQRIVAIKTICKNCEKYPKNKRLYENEIIIFRKLLHENLIQLYEIFEDDENLYMVMEYASGGDFLDVLTEKERLSERESLFYFRQIISGLQFLHYKGIAHLDIKLENLLLINSTLKIADFGFSSNLPEGQFLTKFFGTLRYTPPEILKNFNYSGELADVWSVGIVLYIFLCGHCPFEEDSAFQILEKAQKRDIVFPNHLSPSVINLLQKMIEPDVNQRITINEITKHKWFLQNDIPSLIYKDMTNTRINPFRLIPQEVNEKIFLELQIHEYDLGTNTSYHNRVWNIKRCKNNNWIPGYRILYSFYDFPNKSGGKTHPFILKEFSRQKSSFWEISEFYNYYFVELVSNRFYSRFGYQSNLGLKNLMKLLVNIFNALKFKISILSKNEFKFKCVRKKNRRSSEIFFLNLFQDVDSIVIDVQNCNTNQILFLILNARIKQNNFNNFRNPNIEYLI